MFLLNQLLEASFAFAVLQLVQVTGAERVNKHKDTEGLPAISELTSAKTAGDRYKAIPQGMSIMSRNALNIPSGQECNNYRNLSNPDRARRAVNNKQRFCDHSVYDSNFTSGWYRFTGDAGDKMASSCVPIFRCSTVFQGWLNGSHPTGNFSLARRRVCFHWNADCCHDHVDIWIRNCGGFFVYDLPMAPQCPGRYCGNGEGPLNNPSKCGGTLKSLTGQITSPGHPNYMEPITCQWTIKATFDAKILLYFEDMTLSFEGCQSNNLTIVAENERHTFCRKRDPFYLLITKRTPIQINILYESVYWNKMSGFKLRFAMITENLDDAPSLGWWNISAHVKSKSEIQVSWTHLNDSVLKSDQHIYGYVLLYKPLDYPLKKAYILAKPDVATIPISGLTGGTEYALQVVALVDKSNSSSTLYGSATLKETTSKGECYYYNNLTSPTRAQGAPKGNYCDRDLMATPKWWRFGGEAGTQMATSCVPKGRCGTASPGWMDGALPSVQDGVVMRTGCFHWFEDCCKWKVDIKVRNCGRFYVYRLHSTPACRMRYCGNKGGCGDSFNDTSGTLTSPGYPTRIYWNTKCQWNFTAPPNGVIVVVVEHLSIPISARCLKFSLSLENADRDQVDKVCGVRRSFTWMSQGSAKLRFFSERAASRWVGFKARYFIFKNNLTDITDIPRWTVVSATAINSTAISVQWGPYPNLPVNPSVTEYLVICVPDGQPLNATVFTTDISQNSLTVTGLITYTNYTVQIVVDKNGNSSSFDDYRRSQSVRVRTGEDIPSEGPRTVKAVATDNAITVSWGPIPEHARNGEITSYVIYYKKAWTSDSYSTKTVGSKDRKAILKGLESVTEYRIEMAGVTSVGVGTKTRAVFAMTACKDSMVASKSQYTWTFSSPRYPSQYPSNITCTWSIGSTIGKNEKMYIVFDEFHLESGCSDYVSVMTNGKRSPRFCGKRDPFAVKLTSQSGEVKLKSDEGLEEKGFHARVFATIMERTDISFPHSAEDEVIYNSTLRWITPKNKDDILEYVVLYSGDNGMIWEASITNTTKAVLTGLDPKNVEEYKVILLIRTNDENVHYATTKFKLPEPATTSSPKTAEIPAMKGSTIYPFGDKMVPNTRYFSTRCFRIDIPGDGMQFYNKRHHMVHICRNGVLLFETEQLIRWSRRFSERESVFNKTAIIAPYWALTDVEDAFVVHNISKVFYRVYDSSDVTAKEILNQATYDVKTFHLNVTDLYKKDDCKDCYEFFKMPNENFEAKWVLVVTWVNLRPPNAHNLPSSLNNTFQVVLITDGVCSFVIYNYPTSGIQWSAPTVEKYYKHYTFYRGLPVVGLNGGEKKREYYHVKGSGETGIVNINSITGKTVRTTEDKDKKDYYNEDLQPGKWFFRVETALPRKPVGKDKCKTWFKSQPDHHRFTEYLEPCPCTYRQALWDERFKMEPYGWPFICADSIFPSIDGWEQKCCYSTLTGALVKGYPGGGYPVSPNLKPWDKENPSKYDSFAFIRCCVFSSQCKLFYKKRPSDDCNRYEETEWSWLWGDPHFVTLDGLNYTFNGLGEYIMADISNGLFQLQARTKLVEGEGKATVFVSAVAKETGSSAVQVNLKHGQGLEVLVNGTALDHTTLTETSTLFNGSVALSRPDNTSITVLFPSGTSVKMTDVKGSLAILLAAPEKFKNKTRGLLGVWNGNPEDDLTTPTGGILPTNSTGRKIHYEFGQLWQVTNSNSLFTYEEGENFNTFSNSSFVPMFIEDFKFFNKTVRQEALVKCKGDVNCLFDAAATNDVTMGTSTKIVGSRLKNESEALKNSVPKFLNASSTFFVTVNTTARIEIFAKDDDGDPLTFNVSGILPETLDTNTDSGGSVVISWEVTMDKVKFEVTVMDDKGAVALLRPDVHVCACHHGGYCSSDSSNVFADSTNDTFLIMPCTCIHGYTGRFCENDLDACQANLNPCYPGVKCTDLPPPEGVFGYRCGPCPRGFSGDGATCLDLDECEGGDNGCSQICVNTPGSFVCDCNQGYRLSIDQKTCNDIDECFPSSDCMQKCKNTNGGYTCECDAGFKVDPNNPKKCIPKVPCTDGDHGCEHICYTKDGRQQCACHQGYKLLDDQKTCEDIDECSTRKYRCNQYCHNTKGSYYCSCKKGFRMNNDVVTCADVDECMELTYQCPDPSQICLNTAGSYKCVCGPGLYLTVNNTCREILPGHTTPSPGPARTPKPPSGNQKNNAVRITVKDLNIFEWNERLDNKFKQSVAKAVTSFCASKDEECKETRKRERRALDYIPYTADQVHLLPGFPKQINLKSRDLAAVIAFYVEFPPEVVSTSGDSIKGEILVEIVSSAKADIEKALNRTISSITLNKKEEPSKKEEREKFNIYVIIGVSLAGLLVIGIVGLLIRRDTTRNATLRVKRNQEKEQSGKRTSNVNNACYDDGIPGVFRLAPAQSTTDILEENGNENVQTAELGIDNLEVDVK